MGNVVMFREKVDQRNKGASREQSKIRVLAIERMLDEGKKSQQKKFRKGSILSMTFKQPC